MTTFKSLRSAYKDQESLWIKNNSNVTRSPVSEEITNEKRKELVNLMRAAYGITKNSEQSKKKRERREVIRQEVGSRPLRESFVDEEEFLVAMSFYEKSIMAAKQKYYDNLPYESEGTYRGEQIKQYIFDSFMKRLDCESENNIVNLAKWRSDIRSLHKKDYNLTYEGVYRVADAELLESTETGRDIVRPAIGLILDKKPLSRKLINHPNNNWNDVFIDKTSSRHQVYIKRNVLTDTHNPMYGAVQKIIEKRRSEGYRLVTKSDLEKIQQCLMSPERNSLSPRRISLLKGESYLCVQVLAGWEGDGFLLDADGQPSKSQVNFSSAIPDSSGLCEYGDTGTLFFVKDC